MPNSCSNRFQRILLLLAGLLVLKVTVSIVLNYGDYFPADFSSDFLRGREAYFSGSYQWAFYTHIVSGPCALLLGLLLVSDRLRARFANWHRCLGRVQTANVLLLVAPSGLWMAYYAQTGVVAALGFASLAIGTAVCIWSGWRSAVSRRFAEHRSWMWRCFLLLCSAIVLRLIAGAFTVAGVEGLWTYPLAAWAGWLLPLTAFELLRWNARRVTRHRGTAAPTHN